MSTMPLYHVSRTVRASMTETPTVQYLRVNAYSEAEALLRAQRELGARGGVWTVQLADLAVAA